MRNNPLTIIMLLAVLAISRQAYALDILELKSGGKLKGSIVKTEDGTILLDTLPGRVTILRENVNAVKKIKDPGWYIQRITGRSRPVSIEILDHALMSDEGSNAIREKYVELCVAEAEQNLTKGLIARAGEYAGRALLARPTETRVQKLLNKCNRLQKRTAVEIKALKAELKTRPENEYARFMLGEAYRKLGDEEKAFDAYYKVIEGKVPFDGGIEKMEQLRKFIAENLQVTEVAVAGTSDLPSDAKQQELKLGNLHVYYYDDAITDVLIRKLPAIYRTVAVDLGVKTNDDDTADIPCVIRILKNHNEFIAATGNKYGAGYTSGNVIWTYHGANGMLENVIPHEMAHAVLRHTVGRLPLWIDEGLAVRQEVSAGTYWARLRESGRMPLFRVLQDFTPASKQENDLFYASAFSIVDMLLQNGGMPRLYRLIETLKEKQVEQAIKQIYAVPSLRELEARWEKYLEE